MTESSTDRQLAMHTFWVLQTVCATLVSRM